MAIAVSASKPVLADAHAPAQHNVVIRANNSDSVSQAWKLQNCDDRIRLVAPPLASALAPAPDDGHAQRPVHTRPPATNPNLALSKHHVPGFSSSSSAPSSSSYLRGPTVFTAKCIASAAASTSKRKTPGPAIDESKGEQFAPSGPSVLSSFDTFSTTRADDATSLGQKQRRDESLLLMQRKRKDPAPASDSLQHFAQAPTPVTAPSQCIRFQGTRNKPKHTKVVSPITWLLQACLDVGLISQLHASEYSDPEEIIARWPRDKGYATKERFKTRGGITEAEFWPKVLERYPQSQSSGVFTDFGSEYFFQGLLCALLGDFQEVVGIELDEESFEKSVQLAKHLANKAETENKFISNIMLIRGA